ncbi:hypothetical protein JCM3765_006932 [Sporobolomyces pararoseus]
MKKPVDSKSRSRHYKSCRSCREAKTKCDGLEEEYLKKLDSSDYVHPDPELPQCNRCKKRGFHCTFDPPRRKGRPPRTRPYDFGIRFPPDDHSIRTSSRHSSLASSDSRTSSVPPSSRGSPTPTVPLRQESQSLRKSPQQAVDIEWIAGAYLFEIFVWNPLLPPNFPELHSHLTTSDPLLLSAISCTINPSLRPPPFPLSTPQISISTLQAAVIFALQSFGVGDQSRAASLIGWASTEIQELGWNGHDESELSAAIQPHERKALIACGWRIFWLSISFGVFTGNRNLLLEPQLPSEVTPRNIYHHSLALLRDSTDLNYLQALGFEDQCIYNDWVIGRGERIYLTAVNYLDSTTPEFAPSINGLDPSSLILAAAREQALEAAIISAVSTILALTSASLQPHALFPGLPYHLSTNATFSDSAIASITRASNQILSLCKTTRNRQGNLLSFEQHSPTWCASILIAAFGLLAQTRANAGGGGGGGNTLLDVSGVARRQLEEDLDFCETLLIVQSKWPISEMCRSELVSMRRSYLSNSSQVN